MQAFVTIICLVAMASAVTNGNLCNVVGEAEAVKILPEFTSKEFTIDIELASSEHPEVAQIMMYYSKTKNQVRLNVLEDKMVSDQFIYFSDQELLDISYMGGRGNCVANNITGGIKSFLVGQPKDGSKVQGPLGVLRMTGKSGFGNDEIKVKKVQTTTKRGMTVDAFESCQMWTKDGEKYTVKVTHYFSNSAWHNPSGSVIPVALIVEGSGNGKSFTHTYSFFNVQLTVDPVKLETPPGIFCKRERGYPFPALPESIKFSGESIDKESGFLTYIEEIFSVSDKIAIMKIQPQGLEGTDRKMKTIEVLHDYQTGLAFILSNYGTVCDAVLNITESNTQIPLPFDKVEKTGKVRQLTMKEFFYVTEVGYHYVGVRNVRNVPCDAFVTRSQDLTDSSKLITVEWYFARSANAQLPRIPMKSRLWYDDTTTTSKDLNIYDVDFTRVDLHQFDVRPCFPDSAMNHFQCVLVAESITEININAEHFRANTRKTLARVAGVLFWRVVDLQFYFTDVPIPAIVMEFAIMNAPPYAGDVDGTPYKHVSLAEATNSLQTAVKDKLPIQATNTITKEMINLQIKNFQVL